MNTDVSRVFDPKSAPADAVYGFIPHPRTGRPLDVPGILPDPLGGAGSPGLFTGAGNPLRVAGRRLAGRRQAQMAGRLGGVSPSLAELQPNVPLTNIVVDKFIQGGWIWPKVVPTKRVPTESYKWVSEEGVLDAKVISAPERSLAGLGNVVIGPSRTYKDGRTKPWQLRAFYTDEELRDAANPALVRLSRVRRLLAAMNFGVEAITQAFFTVSALPVAQVFNWTAPFSSANSTISKDIRALKAAYELLSGGMPAYMLFGTVDTYNAWIDSPEMRRDYQGFYFRQVIGGENYDPDKSSTPFVDLVPIVPRARFDNAPFSGTFSPARVWNQDPGTVFFGYSPSIMVQPGALPMDWDGQSPTYVGGFQTAQGNTAPFQVYEQLDPNYVFNKVHWLGIECYRDERVIDDRLIFALQGGGT